MAHFSYHRHRFSLYETSWSGNVHSQIQRTDISVQMFNEPVNWFVNTEIIGENSKFEFVKHEVCEWTV